MKRQVTNTFKRLKEKHAARMMKEKNPEWGAT